MRALGRRRWLWLAPATAAAVMSFDALERLARRADVAPSLAWLLPVAIDATVVIATEVWVTGVAGAPATRYARFLAVSAFVLSVAGNAAEHAMSAYDIVTPWWVVVAVSAVPSVALAATVHLAALLAAATRTATDTVPASVDDTAATRVAAEAPQQQLQPSSKDLQGLEQPAATDTGVDALPAPRTHTEAMREIFDRYRVAGRLDELSGAGLARMVGAADSLGRRNLRKWTDQLAATQSATGVAEGRAA